MLVCSAVLFVYVYAILARDIFGGRMVFVDPDTNTKERVRWHFDTFGASLLTVFQVTTPENWNQVLYDATRAAGWAGGAFIVSLYLLGNYVIVNLFCALLLLGFEDDHIENMVAGGGAAPPPASPTAAAAAAAAAAPTAPEPTRCKQCTQACNTFWCCIRYDSQKDPPPSPPPEQPASIVLSPIIPVVRADDGDVNNVPAPQALITTPISVAPVRPLFVPATSTSHLSIGSPVHEKRTGSPPAAASAGAASAGAAAAASTLPAPEPAMTIIAPPPGVVELLPLPRGSDRSVSPLDGPVVVGGPLPSIPGSAAVSGGLESATFSGGFRSPTLGHSLNSLRSPGKRPIPSVSYRPNTHFLPPLDRPTTLAAPTAGGGGTSGGSSPPSGSILPISAGSGVGASPQPSRSALENKSGNTSGAGGGSETLSLDSKEAIGSSPGPSGPPEVAGEAAPPGPRAPSPRVHSPRVHSPPRASLGAGVGAGAGIGVGGGVGAAAGVPRPPVRGFGSVARMLLNRSHGSGASAAGSSGGSGSGSGVGSGAGSRRASLEAAAAAAAVSAAAASAPSSDGTDSGRSSPVLSPRLTFALKGHSHRTIGAGGVVRNAARMSGNALNGIGLGTLHVPNSASGVAMSPRGSIMDGGGPTPPPPIIHHMASQLRVSHILERIKSLFTARRRQVTAAAAIKRSKLLPNVSSFLVFPPTNQFRLWCWWLVHHRVFEVTVFVMIVFSCLLLTLDEPGLDKTSTLAVV